MKKYLLATGVVLSAIAAQDASALPVFARQTGMACSACHFQHFPKLNAFGRAFKASGFTLMGAQGRIEGENLSIPDALNLGVFVTAYSQSESNGGSANGTKLGTPGNGGEESVFLGGRLSDFAGFLSEVGLGGGAAAAASAKLPVLFEVGNGSRAGIVAYGGDQGAAYSFETLNTGASDTHKMMGNPGINRQHVQAAYAASYLNMRTDATGIHGVWVNPDVGFINIGKFASAPLDGAGANTLPLTYARGVANFDLAGFDSAVGVQMITGDTSALGYNGSATAAALGAAPLSYKATVIDFQAQGELGGNEFGLYVSAGSAPVDNTYANSLNEGVFTKSTFNVAVEYSILPHTTIQVSMRNAKNGVDNGSGASQTDNAFMIGATYDLAQNIALGLNYTQQSGTAWNTPAGGTEPVGKHASTLLLEAAF
jgi:hypothetical protein